MGMARPCVCIRYWEGFRQWIAYRGPWEKTQLRAGAQSPLDAGVEQEHSSTIKHAHTDIDALWVVID